MKRLAAVILSIVLMLGTIGSASANQWGAKGKLVSYLLETKAWDDYGGITDQVGEWMVLGGRYHNVLMFAGEDGLHLYHTAVWQPDDQKKMQLSMENGDLTLTSNNESFTFGESNDQMVLIRAQLGNISVQGNFNESEAPYSDFYGYDFSDGEETVRLAGWKLPLSDFNIHLFPRTLGEVRHHNLMHAHIKSGEDILHTENAGTIEGHGKDTVPVYSAPYGKSAWRAAKGKAAVSLKGTFTPYKGYTNADGKSYTCLSYEISERTQRIGWVENSKLGSYAMMPIDAVGESFINVIVRTNRNTFLTDDPFCSMYAQFDAPEGMQFDCMGLVGTDWAYVSAEVNSKGQFTDGGAIVWGFIPLRDLDIDTDAMDMKVDQSVMEQLAGSWIFEAGGSMGPDGLVLNSDGTFESANVVYGADGEEVGMAPYFAGTWQVTNYNPGCGLYWDNTSYEITFIYEDGTANVKGLTIGEGFALIDNEGGGGYIRKDLEATDEEVDHG